MSDPTHHAEPAEEAPRRKSQLVSRLRRVRRLHKVQRLPFARFMYAMRGIVLTVEGTIGIGKSTLCRTIVKLMNEAEIRAEYLPEDYDKNMLKTFLNYKKAHPGKYNPHAAPFQLDVLTRRTRTYERALALQKQGVTAVVDRSLVGDYAFALLQYDEGNFTEEQWEEYCTRVEAADLLDPDLTLFLKCRQDIALERCNRRGRSGEDAYTLGYFRDLDDAYMDAFEAVDYPCLYVDWTLALEVDEEGFLDRSAALDVLAHASTQFVPQPVLLPHRMQPQDQYLTAYQRYGYTADRADVARVLIEPQELPQEDGETRRVRLYNPTYGDVREYTITLPRNDV